MAQLIERSVSALGGARHANCQHSEARAKQGVTQTHDAAILPSAAVLKAV
jgi:hypothetical protein